MKAVEYLQLAQQSNKDKDYGKALNYAGEAIKLEAENLDALYEKLNALYLSKQYEQALLTSKNVAKIKFLNAKLLYRIGTIYDVFKNYEEASKYFDQAIQLSKVYAEPWYGKGKGHFDRGNYDEAFDCYNKSLQINPKLIVSLHGKGTVYSAIGKYNKALDCFSAVIKINPNDSSAWTEKGKVFYKKINYDQALECFDKAILFDEKNPSPWNGKGVACASQSGTVRADEYFDKSIQRSSKHVTSWNGKGNITLVPAKYNQATAYFKRAIYLGGNSTISNILSLASNYPNFPYLTYKLLQFFISPINIYKWNKLLNLTIEHCRHLIIYNKYLLELTDKVKDLKKWEWKQYQGLINYFMGDSIEAHYYFLDILKIKKTDLRTYYYLIRSCEDFIEPTESYFEQAKNIADKIKPQKAKLGIFSRKKIVAKNYKPEEIQQLYYAGQIYYLDEEFKTASLYFEAIHKQYLPAAYMYLLVKYELKSSLYKGITQEIIKLENQSTNLSFTNGFPTQQLHLDAEDFRVPFFHYAHYYEIEEGIGLFENAVNKYHFQDEIQFSTEERKAFWYTWELTPNQYEEIIDLVRLKEKERLAKQILNTRTIELEKLSKVNPTDEQINEVITEAESENLIEAFEKLKDEANVENRLAGMINDYRLSQARHYHLLTAYFQIIEKIQPVQKIYLDIYAIIKEEQQDGLSDISLAGVKDVIKAWVGVGIDLLGINLLGVPITPIIIFFKPFAKATIAELVMKWLKQPNIKFSNYKEFKADFLQFIAEEKIRLGEKFDTVYPLYGFDDWLK